MQDDQNGRKNMTNCNTLDFYGDNALKENSLKCNGFNIF
jgi:hypothetical protein